jgi:hypothetical protein
MTEWVIDVWNQVNVLSTEFAWNLYQEIDMEINDEQEKISMNELINDEFLLYINQLNLQDF